MTALLAGALLAGLVGSPHCVGMCGGFATSVGGARASLAWHLGRLATYTVLGSVAGLIGGVGVRAGAWTGVAAAVLLLLFAARLTGVLPSAPMHLPGLVRMASRFATLPGLPARFAFGTLTALLPCGLTWSALTLAVAAGGGAGGALAMTAFWLGTVPALAGAAVGLRRLTTARPWSRRLLAAGVFAAGLWSISVRVTNSEPAPCNATEAP